jgi:hypothetical protein
MNRKEIYEKQLNISYNKINESNLARVTRPQKSSTPFYKSSGLQTAQDVADLTSLGLAAGSIGTAATGVGLPASPFLELGSSAIDLANAGVYAGKAGLDLASGNYGDAASNLGSAGLRAVSALPYVGTAAQVGTSATKVPIVASKLASIGPKAADPELATLAQKLLDRTSKSSQIQTGVRPTSSSLAVREVPFAKRLPMRDISPSSTGTELAIRQTPRGLPLVAKPVHKDLAPTSTPSPSKQTPNPKIPNIRVLNVNKDSESDNEAAFLPIDPSPYTANAAIVPVGQFNPGEISGYGKSIATRQRDYDPSDRFSTPHFYRVPVSMAMMFKVPVTEENDSNVTKSEKDSQLYSRVKKYVSHYLRSQSGESLRKKLSQIKVDKKTLDNKK